MLNEKLQNTFVVPNVTLSNANNDADVTGKTLMCAAKSEMAQFSLLYAQYIDCADSTIYVLSFVISVFLFSSSVLFYLFLYSYPCSTQHG